MPTYNTPGVFVEEISTFPPSVAEVETAIPAFIGFTEKGGILDGKPMPPKRISSLVEYQLYFGSALPESKFRVDVIGESVDVSLDLKDRSKFILFYAIQLYFANGGGPCYIASAGNFGNNPKLEPDAAMYLAALDKVREEDEPTLLVFPDAPYIIPARYNDVITTALAQCRELGDRFTIIDVIHDPAESIERVAENFRKIGSNSDNAKYGAAYFPALTTSIPYVIDDRRPRKEEVPAGGGAVAVPKDAGGAAAPEAVKIKEKPAAAEGLLANFSNAQQNQARAKLKDYGVELYPSAAVAGVYANVDSTRGVWKAPANVSLNYVKAPVLKITDEQQARLNIDQVDGKSINAIRSFVGRGTKIWGARTLAGNDNEWRFINIRRFFNMVEESIKKSTSWAVFEPNDVNTWTKVRSMIENYLLLKWKDGALAGAKPDNAFYVRVGLPQTMVPQDVLEGRMIIEIELAVVRPAEFIILKFSHKLQVS